MNSKLLALSLLAILLNLGCARKPAYTCVAGPNEVCASDQFVADLARFHAYQKKYQPPQDEMDQMNGLVTRLNGEVPAGFQWNEEKKRFVKMPAPNGTPAPAPGPAK